MKGKATSMTTSAAECAVKIAVRERPRMSGDSARQSVIATKDGDKDRNVIERAGKDQDNIIIVGDRPFVFDAILNPTVSQQQLYEMLVKPMVDKLLRGFYCTVLAYGQTGTGKSYTMGMHTEAFSDDQGGVVPRTFRDIFDRVNASNADGSTETQLAISFIEIYNEKVIDLLASGTPNHENTANHPNVTFSGQSAVAKCNRFAGATRRPVRHLSDAHRVLADGNRQRHVRPTKMNAQSSRSHAICTVHATVRAANRHTVSAMHLVDLAGSEGVRRTGAQGAALAEGVHINQGLLSIGKVLQALSSGQRLIPYRDSVLSTVLQDSLNGNSYLTLLACISPLYADLSETLSTLRFANGAKSLRSTPQVNAIIAEIKKTRTPAKLKTPSKHLLPASDVEDIDLLSTPARRALAARKSLFDQRPVSAFKRRPSTKPMLPATVRNVICTPCQIAANPNVRLAQRLPSVRKTFAASTPFAGRQQTHRPPIKFDRPATAPAVDNNEATIGLSDESQMFLDVSTSTVFELKQPPMPVLVQSYSPVVRNCVNEVRLQMRELMQSMAMDASLRPQPVAVLLSSDTDTVANSTLDDNNSTSAPKTETADVRKVRISRGSAVPSTSNDQPSKTSTNVANISWNTLTRGLREIVRDELTMIRMNNNVTTQPETTAVTVANNTIEKDAMEANDIETLRNDLLRASTFKQSVSSRPSRRPSVATRCSARISMRRLTQTSQPAIEEPSVSVRIRNRRNTKAVVTKTKTILWQIDKESSAEEKIRVQGKFVLDLFNTGTLRELQILPQVGPKLAYQIITYRLSQGKLQNLQQMAAMPIWRGKSWDRFKALNYL